jgi:protein-S-isoprenylcysteine O-methyltransferase Ste14
MNRQFILFGVVLTITMISQIVLAIIFYNDLSLDWLCNIGWPVLWVSAVFGLLPILTFRKFGGVDPKKSYMRTQRLVDKGIYRIVRHPQYVSGILISVGLYLITQHWASLLLGAANIFQFVLSAISEEDESRVKFGTAYEEYMQRVPRFDFISGLFRLILPKKKSN